MFSRNPIHRRWSRLDAAALALIWTALFIARFLGSPSGSVADEELHTPSVAALLACGEGWGALPWLQYADFCGGCTAEAILITPAFALLGPQLWAWRLVPLAFGLALLLLTQLVASRLAGRAAGLIAGLALCFGPTYFGANTVVGFGSHFEVSALMVASLLLWMRWLRSGRALDGALFGLACGLAFWFAYSSALTAPVLVTIGLLARPRSIRGLTLPSLSFGLLLGLTPWLWTQLTLRGSVMETPMVSVYGMGLSELATQSTDLPARLSVLLGPIHWDSAFFMSLDELRVPAGLSWTLGAWLGLALLAQQTLERLQRARGRVHEAAVPLAVLCLALSYAGAFLFLAPGRWDGAPASANSLRYLLPLMPLLALALGVATSTLGRGPLPAKVAAGALLLMVLVPGITAQGVQLMQGSWTTRGVHLLALDRGTAAFRCQPDIRPREAEGRGDPQLDDAISTLPRCRAARQILSHGLGYSIGDELARPPASRLERLPWASLSQLGPLDRWILLQGAAERLAGLEGWGVRPLGHDPAPRLAQALSLMEPSLGEELVRSLHLQHTEPAHQAARQLGQGPAAFATAPAESREAEIHRRGQIWALGWAAAKGGRSDEEDLASGLDRLERALLSVPEHRVELFLEGAAYGAGERWGYRDDLPDRWLQAFAGWPPGRTLDAIQLAAALHFGSRAPAATASIE
jgi:hypothetical protein